MLAAMLTALLLSAILVIDGDTVAIGSRAGEHVRLLGVDAPETRRAKCAKERRLGERASAELAAMVAAAESYALDRRGRDAYGRTLAHLYLDGDNAGDRLIAEGFARPWRGRPRDWCGG